MDSSFDVVHEKSLNANDVPNVFSPKERKRAKSATGSRAVNRNQMRRRLLSANPRKTRGSTRGAFLDLQADTACGMSFKDVARYYSTKNGLAKKSHFIKDYYMHKPKDKHLFRYNNMAKYFEPNKKDEGGYLTHMVKRAKAIPSCTKYSKILNWGKMAGTKSNLPQAEKVTIFREIAKNARGKPGPTSYKAGPCKDKVMRNTSNFFTSKNDKVTITRCIEFEKSFVPPPVSKKQIKYELTEKREPFMAHLKTMVGRENASEEGTGANGI